MESTFITEALDGNINYIAIKLIEKQTKSTNNVKGGLFKGIINHKDTDGKEHAFILTEQTNDKNKSVISGMNIKYYDILSMVIDSSACKTSIFATNTEKDQERMYGVLDLCLEILTNSNMIEEDYLINTALYTSIPADINKVKAVTRAGCYNNTTNIYKPKQKQVPQPGFFESKNVDIEEVEKMKLKLESILTKTFTPIMPETKSGEEEKSVAKNLRYGHGYGYGYGYGL